MVHYSSIHKKNLIIFRINYFRSNLNYKVIIMNNNENNSATEDFETKYKFFGINKHLYDSYFSFTKDKWLDYKLKENVVKFLSTMNQEDRAKFAEEMIKSHWDIYQKNYHFFINKLMKSELAIKKINKSHRDHVVHSAYVFLLGIYLFEKDSDIKNAFYNHYEQPNDIENRFMFMWNIISTFHDIAYAFQSFSKEMNSYISEINKGTINNNISFGLYFKNLVILNNDKNSFEILKELQEKRIGKSIDLEGYFEKELENGIIDHGILSSLILLKITDNLYEQQVDWPIDFFNEVFPEIALSIALHNIKWEKLSEKSPIITLNDFPLCYLLILADTLQEWDRPAIARPSIPSTALSIEFDENEKIFRVKVALSPEYAEDMNKDLVKKILCDDNKKLPDISAALK